MIFAELRLERVAQAIAARAGWTFAAKIKLVHHTDPRAALYVALAQAALEADQVARGEQPGPPASSLRTPMICAGCGCGDDRSCTGDDGETCFWIEHEVCSVCRERGRA